MAGAFEQWVLQLKLPWLGTNGRRIFGGFASVMGDRSVTWAERATKEHLPEYAGDTSLSLIGSERRLFQGPSESSEDFAVRLVNAMRQWRDAGSPLGLLYAMEVDGFSGYVMVQQNGRANSLDSPPADDPRDSLNISDLGANINMGDHPWWKFDEDTDFCSRFAFVVDGTGGDPLTDADDRTRLCRLIADWKPAKATCMGFYVLTSGELWGWPVGTWGDPGDWGGAVTFYPYA